MRLKGYLDSVESLATAELLCREPRFCESRDLAHEIDTYIEDDDIFIIKDGERLVGWAEDSAFGKCMMEHLTDPSAPTKTAAEIMRPIIPEHVVESDATVTAILSVVASHDCACLLVGNALEIRGVVRIKEALRAPALVYYLCLSLELECAALDLCALYPRSFYALKKERQLHAIDNATVFL